MGARAALSTLRDGVRTVARRHDLDRVVRFVMFVGYPRSGHSLVGALMNAHPRMVIAHELDAAKFALLGWSRRRILISVLDRDAWWQRQGWKWEGWDYTIPGQYQGVTEDAMVMGDKKGGLTSLRLHRNPATLDAVASAMQMPIKLIHHIRNPFDTLATMARKRQPDVETLDDAIEQYFGENVSGVRIAKEWAPHGCLLDVRHEDLIADPGDIMRRVCSHVGQDTTPAYLDACRAIVHPSPTNSRTKVEWSAAQIDRVHREIESVPWFRGYTFD